VRHRTRLLLITLTATTALATALAGTSNASRLSSSNQNFRATWSPVSFQTEGEGGIIVECNVTVEGSFHYRTIIKQARSLIGYVTKATIAHPCGGSGEAWADNGIENAGLGTIPNSLPWHLTYEAFEGTLPNITGIRFLVRPRYTVRTALTGLCKMEGNSQGVLKLNAGAGIFIKSDETIALSKTSGGFFCVAGHFGNTGGTVTLLGNTTSITITLI
jgi:hypothetical protein